MMKTNINVIDLDETLLPYDSFRLLIKNELFKFDFYVIKLTLKRVLRLILNSEFKLKIVLYLQKKYDEDFFKSYADKIFTDINVDVMTLIENENDNGTVNVLLSASPNIFVGHFIHKLGWVGTGSFIDNEGKFIHLHGKEKVKYLMRTFEPENYNYNFAISDSESDDDLLALFKKNKKWTLH